MANRAQAAFNFGFNKFGNHGFHGFRQRVAKAFLTVGSSSSRASRIMPALGLREFPSHALLGVLKAASSNRSLISPSLSSTPFSKMTLNCLMIADTSPLLMALASLVQFVSVVCPESPARYGSESSHSPLLAAYAPTMAAV